MIKLLLLTSLIVPGCLALCGCMQGGGRLTERLIRPIQNDIQTGAVVSIKVLHVPDHLETPMALGPPQLEQYARTVWNVEVSDLGDSIGPMLSAMRLSATDEQHPDLRWGVYFIGRGGEVIHSIYVNGRGVICGGRDGVVDGRIVRMNQALVDWLEDNFTRAQ